MTTAQPDPGHDDVLRAADLLADRLPDPLRPLAALAYNYWWAWQADGPGLFASLDPRGWERSGHNPVMLLLKTPAASLAEAAGDPTYVGRLGRLVAGLEAALATPPRPGPITPEAPAAFLCAEFGVHSSLPIYSGGLGVLAGDVLKRHRTSRCPWSVSASSIAPAPSTSASTCPATSTSTGPMSIPTGCRACP